MKISILLTLFLALSCAHNNKSQVNAELEAYKFKNPRAIEAEVMTILDHHPELSSEKKEQARSVLLTGLDRYHQLQDRESKLAQHFLDLALNDKADFKELAIVRKEMQKNYKSKSDLVAKTTRELKQVLGITPDPSMDLGFINRSIMAR